MTTINLMRNPGSALSESEMDIVRRFLFGLVDGWTEDDKAAWRRTWKRIYELEVGELMRLDLIIPRNYRFHKKLFSLLQVGYDAWEPGRKRMQYKGRPVAKNFERFRKEIIILAGYFEQTFDLEGRMRLEAQSISYASMDDSEFEKLYSAVADVLLDRILTAYAGRAELDEVVRRMEVFL